MDLQLTHKIALVTGSTAGIGFAIAQSLAAEGARVLINGRSEARVNEAIARIREAQPNAKVEGLAADLSTASGIETAATRFPDVDILINNLGIFEPVAFEEISDQKWAEIIDANFMSGVRLARHYLPRMKRANWGRILFISSESGVQIPVEMIHYGVTKTMQIALSRGLAETTVGTQVTVNTLLPGPTRSEGVEQFLNELAKQDKVSVAEVEKDFFDTKRPSSLIRRFASPSEIASTAVYLCSPLASATNGAAVRADGGLLRSIL